MTSQTPFVFADGVIEAQIQHGVARIVLGAVGRDGKPEPSGLLIVPVVQLPGLTNGLINLMRQLESRIKDAREKQGEQPSVSAQAEPAAQPSGDTTLPSSFKFQ